MEIQTLEHQSRFRRIFLAESPTEINARLRRRYLDRLGIKVRKLRRLLIERKWDDLKLECYQLALSGENFGFDQITSLSMEVYQSIPNKKLSRAATPLLTREITENLIAAIDSLLIENHIVIS